MTFNGSSSYGSNATSVTGAEKPVPASEWEWWLRVIVWTPNA